MSVSALFRRICTWDDGKSDFNSLENEQRLHRQSDALGEEKKQNYAVGCFFLIFTLTSWEAMGELVQDVQDGYKKPYFIVYTLHCGFAIYMATLVPIIQIYRKCKNQPMLSITMKDIGHATFLNLLLISSDYFWYLSLPRTVVAANNAMYQSMSLFVYIFSVLILGEPVNNWKNIGLLICLVGMGLVVYGTASSDSGGDIVGYLLCLAAVLIFAFYEVIFSKLRGHGAAQETILFTGLMGFMNLFLFWVPVLVWNELGLETFKYPDEVEISKLLINALLGAVYTCSFLTGISFTTPLFMSLGSVFIVPIGVVVDKILHDIDLPILFFVGSGCIIVGFFCAMKDKLNCRDKPSYSIGEKRSRLSTSINYDFGNEGRLGNGDRVGEVEPSAPPRSSDVKEGEPSYSFL